MNRPPHYRIELIGLVFVGGALGTLARYGLTLVEPAPDHWPLATLTVNIVGAFVLGVLLETLLRGGPDEGRRQRVRIFGGPGVLGGFTTYSSLAVDTATLFHDGQWAIGVGYALGSVVLGVAAAAAGIALAGTWSERRTPRGGASPFDVLDDVAPDSGFEEGPE